MPNHWSDMIAWGAVLAAGLYVARRVWRSLGVGRAGPSKCGGCESCAAKTAPSDSPVVQITLGAPADESLEAGLRLREPLTPPRL